MLTNGTHKALIGLGSNKAWLGRTPSEVIRAATLALAALGEVKGRSRLYRSPAWPDPADPEYTNAVVALETRHGPEALLAALHAIEAAFGRVRSKASAERYAPRTLDLDLLALDDRVLATPGLTLPHPGVADRDFVLLPLHDVAPDWRHPVSGLAAAQMIDRLARITATLAP